MQHALHCGLMQIQFAGAPVGHHFGGPPAAIFLHFRGRRHFQNAIGHTLTGKSWPSDTISYIHRPWCGMTAYG